MSASVLQFGLGEFDNGAEAEVVAGLGEFEGQDGLLAKLLGEGKALVSAVGVLPGDTHVAGDRVAEIGEFLAIDFRLEVGGFGARELRKGRREQLESCCAIRAREVWRA